MFRAKMALVTTAAAIVLTVGCGSKTPNDQTNDQSIVTNIQAKLYSDALTKPASIGVAVQNGVVTLSGNVDSSDVALEAMKVANGTPGVRGVNDKMTINGAAAANQVPNPGSTTSPAPVPGTPVASNPSSTAAPPANAPPASAAPANSPPSTTAQSVPSPAEAEPKRPPEPSFITIPAGERLEVRTIDAIDSKTADPGQAYRATLNAPLVHNNRVVIPAGAPVSLVVVTARSAGRIKGQSELEVRASRIEYHGHSYPLDSSAYAEQGKARGKQTAVRTGIGAAAGAVIGALAGGGKGAAIGSAAGGGAGLGYNFFTHGQQVKIPSETVLTFRLEAALRITR